MNDKKLIFPDGDKPVKADHRQHEPNQVAGRSLQHVKDECPKAAHAGQAVKEGLMKHTRQIVSKQPPQPAEYHPILEAYMDGQDLQRGENDEL